MKSLIGRYCKIHVKSGEIADAGVIRYKTHLIENGGQKILSRQKDGREDELPQENDDRLI